LANARIDRKEEKKAVDALFDKAIKSGNAFGYNGPDEEAFCQQFAKFMGGGYADAVNSGTTAVYVALRALNPNPSPRSSSARSPIPAVLCRFPC